jgi:hypothetical protein
MELRKGAEQLCHGTAPRVAALRKFSDKDLPAVSRLEAELNVFYLTDDDFEQHLDARVRWIGGAVPREPRSQGRPVLVSGPLLSTRYDGGAAAPVRWRTESTAGVGNELAPWSAVRFVGTCGSLLFALLAASCGGSSPTAPSGGGGTTSISVPDPAGATSLTYSANVQPILASDCASCHNPSNRSGGYDLSSYAGVMRAVTPGSARSPLVAVTQPNGIMYQRFGATPTAKAETIRRWVVDFNAAQ